VLVKYNNFGMKGLQFILFISVFFAGLEVSGQILDNTEGQAFSDYPYFNTKFISASKIKEIRGKYTFKKQDDIMRKTDYVYVFSFDSLGHLVRHYETAKGDVVNDTIVRLYTYDGYNRLSSLRTSEQSGFMTTYYTYDDNGHIVKEEVFRDIDTLHSILKPQIDRSLLWNTETMSYDDYGNQLRKKVYNSDGNQYIEINRYRDSLGLLTKINELYTFTRDQYNTYYTYGNRGRVENIKTIHNIDTIPITEMEFTYDNYGNLSSKKLYKNGVFTTEYQIIYSEKTGLLSTILIREVSSNFISMIRFSEPTFWDRPEEKDRK